MYWAVKAGEGNVIRLSGQRLRGKMPEMQADIRDLHRLREKTVTAVPRRSVTILATLPCKRPPTYDATLNSK